MVNKHQIKKERQGLYQIPVFSLDKETGLVQTNSHQELCFMESKRSPDGTLEYVNNGILIEGALLVCFDRLKDLNSMLPNANTEKAIAFVGEAINALKERDNERLSKGIVGTMKP